MHISDLIAALHERMSEHGDLPVSPKGDGYSSAHCVYLDEGRLVISDSYFDAVHNLLGGTDDTSEEEAPFHLGGGKGSASSLISVLHARLAECGDLVVYPK